MNPFFYIMDIKIPAYGLMMILGFLFSCVFEIYLCNKKNINIVDQLYLIAYILIASLLGAKLVYIFQNMEQFINQLPYIITDFKRFMDYLGGGFVFYGGLIGGAIGAIFYANVFKINAIKNIETFVIVIPFFHCVGRIGCFLAGCCYGIEYNGLFKIMYTEAIAAPNGINLFPVQLLEALLNFLLFLFLVWIDKWLKKPLSNFGIYLVLYGAIRFFLEFLRGDLIRGIYILSFSQWISLLVVLIGIYIIIITTKKNLFVKLINKIDR